MNKNKIKPQLFAESNITAAADLEPAISIDCTSRLVRNIAELQQLLGITEMEPMAAGTAIKVYKMTQVNTPSQVGEGETISLTKVNRTLAKTIDLTLNKYRRNTSAEAIQKTGREIAINKTDEKLISGVQKEIKQDFYTTIEEGTGTATGKGLQATLAAAWAKVIKFYEDEDATPIYFVSSDDLGDYLKNAQITLQTAFGLSYVENFLGLGTVIVSPRLTAGKVVATAKENLHGAYVPTDSGDVSESFGLTSDATGLVGMTHAVVSGNATIDTLVFSGVVFYPELLDGVIVGTITSDDASATLGAFTVTSVAGTAVGDTKITVSPDTKANASNIYKYKVADAADSVAYGDNVKLWSVWDGTSDITAATDKVITIVEADDSYKAVKAGNATVVAKAEPVVE